MNFSPVAPISGIAGLRFLDRTWENQFRAFESQAQMARDIDYFKENIAAIGSAEELVADRRLLRVALGAFGLDEEIGKKYFIGRILAEGTDAPDTLANRFVDPRYRKFSEAFGFGNILGPHNASPGFAEKVVAQFKERQFEIAIGNSDQNLRLAIGFRREIADFANAGNAADSAWFSILGSTPLRTVFEQAFSLPSEFGTLDIDKQKETLQERSSALFGSSSLEVFKDPANVERLLNQFLAKAQISTQVSGTSSQFVALSILSSSGGSNGIASLLIG